MSHRHGMSVSHQSKSVPVVICSTRLLPLQTICVGQDLRRKHGGRGPDPALDTLNVSDRLRVAYANFIA